jgi:O-antigen/teichoic acid export membrane protein
VFSIPLEGSGHIFKNIIAVVSYDKPCVRAEFIMGQFKILIYDSKLKRSNFIITLANKVVFALGIDKGVSYVSIGYIFYTVFGGVLWFILAAEMPANDFGILSYYFSIAVILGAISILGFDSTLTTFLAKGVKKMLSESVFLTSAAALIISIILAISFKSLPIILIFLSPLFFTLSLAEILGKRLYKEYMIMLIIQRVLSLIFVPALFASHGIDGAMYGYSISYLPLCYRFFISLRTISFSVSTLRPIKNFLFHSYALGILRSLVVFSDKLIIAPLFGIIILGYYQLGIQILMTVSVLPVILSHYLLPQQAANKNENVKKIERLGLVLSVLITVFLIYLTPFIISNLFPRFEVAQTSTQIVLIAGIPLSLTAVLSSYFMARQNSLDILIASGIFLGTEYALIAVLGQWYGLVGISLSPVLAASAQALFLFVMKRRITKPNLGNDHKNI